MDHGGLSDEPPCPLSGKAGWFLKVAWFSVLWVPFSQAPLQILNWFLTSNSQDLWSRVASVPMHTSQPPQSSVRFWLNMLIHLRQREHVLHSDSSDCDESLNRSLNGPSESWVYTHTFAVVETGRCWSRHGRKRVSFLTAESPICATKFGETFSKKKYKAAAQDNKS